MVTRTSKPFTVGVLLLPPTQLLDLSPIDLFGMLTPSYLEDCQRGAGLPAPLVALGVPVTIHYVTASHQASSPTSNPSQTQQVPTSNLVEMTSDLHILSTASLTSPTVKPGSLSALLIPGPDPSVIPSAAESAFVRAHHDAGADILTVCTGALVAGHVGILDGRVATGPRGLMGDLKKKFPNARWVEKRWVRDAGSGKEGKGVVWTSGGISNGQDMVAAYIRQHFPRELADLVCRMADVGDRGQEYESGKVKEAGWWVWLILRSWWKGKGSEKAKNG